MRLVAVRVFDFECDLARAGRRGELELERTVGRGDGFAPGNAHGVARLRASTRDVDLPGQVFKRHVGDGDALRGPVARSDGELLRLSPFARLSRLRDGAHAPEIDAGAQVADAELGRVELIAFDHFAGGDEEGRSGDLDAIVAGRARSGALPAQRDVGRAVCADRNLLQVMRLHGRGHVQQMLAALDRAGRIEGNVFAARQRRVFAAA